MKLVFIGADHEVTGSCHYLEACGKHILVDYGMRQGSQTYEFADLPVPEIRIDYVLLTHAHVDHSGMLPQLCARGFGGQIVTTKATADLCSIMLRDCAHIQMQEAEWKNRKGKRSGEKTHAEPPYTMEDADAAIRLLTPCAYDQVIDLCDGIKIRFTDIGHLLGSASIEVWIEEEGVSKKIVFSGDIGNTDQPLIRDPQYTSEADYVVMESTYGNRYHAKPDVPVDPIGSLAKIIDETLGRGGNLVIPSFAVGRTQEILYFIRHIKEAELVKSKPDFPVYLDSPLAVDATEVFKRNIEDCFDEEAMELVRKGINPIKFPGLNLSITGEESKMINFDKEPKVIISASGMCEAGRIRHHLKHNLWRPECTILFVGYQAEGTLGRVLVDGGVEEVKLFGEPISVQAHIMTLPGMSGHADKQGLIDWLGGFEEKPRKVFLVHGDDESVAALSETLRMEYGYNSYAPYSGTQVDLATGKLLFEASPIPVKKKTIAALSGVYGRLVAAGKRLMAVIEQNQGGANKDLAKFADQISALCEKWQR
ncbi:MAG: MBL fold metallo-hydrolase [Lachnospiraceae bacterium]|nr:MBL fold metallo-hydrolase [Lachnospiraceae bacterium]